MVFFKERVGGRSNDTVEMKIETFVSLDKNGKGVKIKTRFDNEVKDHRVRIMVPTGINSDVHKLIPCLRLLQEIIVIMQVGIIRVGVNTSRDL